MKQVRSKVIPFTFTLLWTLSFFAACAETPKAITSATDTNTDLTTEKPPLVRCTETRKMMGTYVRIVCYAESEAAGKSLIEAAYAEGQRLNRVFSTYDPESEVSRLNKAFARQVVEPVKASRDLLYLLHLTDRVYQASHKAFDPTVGPLVKLWGWSRYHKKLPPQQELDKAKAMVGFDKVIIDQQAKTVQFKKPGMKLDFSAIAKGYIVESMMMQLLDRCESALVDAGGDMSCYGAPPGQKGWKVSLMPFPLRGDDLKKIKPIIVELKNAAVATSGDAYRYIEIDGKRYSHILNPSTGLGMSKRMGVSVVVRRNRGRLMPAVDADALATSLVLLGPDAYQMKGMNDMQLLRDVSAVFMWMTEAGEMKVKRIGFDQINGAVK